MRILAAIVVGSALLASCTTSDDIGPGSATTVPPAETAVENTLSAHAEYTAPKPGTMLTLTSVFKGEEDSEINQLVVASGQDYAIYANILDDGLQGPGDFFIEYSGLYWQEGGLAPLTDYQRRKLVELWPLQPGDAVQLPYQGDLSQMMDIEVVGWAETSTARLGDLDVVKILNSYAERDYSTFSPRLGVSVRIDWGEPGTDGHLGYDELTAIKQVNLAEYAEYSQIATSACLGG